MFVRGDGFTIKQWTISVIVKTHSPVPARKDQEEHLPQRLTKERRQGHRPRLRPTMTPLPPPRDSRTSVVEIVAPPKNERIVLSEKYKHILLNTFF